MVLLGPASLRLDALARGSQTGDALTALKFSRIDRALVERAFVPLRLLRRALRLGNSNGGGFGRLVACQFIGSCDAHFQGQKRSGNQQEFGDVSLIHSDSFFRVAWVLLKRNVVFPSVG
jgi:hypothetical protein